MKVLEVLGLHCVVTGSVVLSSRCGVIDDGDPDLQADLVMGDHHPDVLDTDQPSDHHPSNQETVAPHLSSCYEHDGTGGDGGGVLNCE